MYAIVFFRFIQFILYSFISYAITIPSITIRDFPNEFLHTYAHLYVCLFTTHSNGMDPPAHISLTHPVRKTKSYQITKIWVIESSVRITFPLYFSIFLFQSQTERLIEVINSLLLLSIYQIYEFVHNT